MKKSRKLKNKLAGRVADWENIVKGNSDIIRKHPKGFRKPGSNK